MSGAFPAARPEPSSHGREEPLEGDRPDSGLDPHHLAPAVHDEAEPARVLLRARDFELAHDPPESMDRPRLTAACLGLDGEKKVLRQLLAGAAEARIRWDFKLGASLSVPPALAAQPRRWATKRDLSHA